MKILLVDDSADNLNLFKLFLSKSAHQIFIATNGQEALYTFKKELPDIVFMDLEMPIMGGMESVTAMRKFESETELDPANIYSLTGSTEQEVIDSCIKAGFTKVLRKPISKQDFLSYIP